MKDIYLTGPKHSGKTSVGKALAEIMSGEFIDLDELMTKQSELSPRELYLRGAEFFRAAEMVALGSLFGADTDTTRIIATGGGIADNAVALTLLKCAKNSLIVFLDVSAATAWQRIFDSGELPPFLKTENPRETHRALHERRAEVYRSIAGLVIDAEGKTAEEIAEEILEKTSHGGTEARSHKD